MGKIIKFILSFISWVIISLIIIPVLISLLLHIQPLQAFIVSKVVANLEQRIGTEVKIDYIYFKPFNSLWVEGLFVKGFEQDTLLYAKQLVVPIHIKNLIAADFSLGQVKLDSAKFYLREDSTGLLNLTRITRAFASSKKEKSGTFKLNVGGLKITDMDFKYHKNRALVKPYGVSFQDLDVRDFNFTANNIKIIDDSISLIINTLSLKERSGFVLNNLSSDKTVVCSSGLNFDKLKIITPESDVYLNYLYLCYSKWSSFNDFINKVSIESEIVNSSIDNRTISYFAPSLKDWNMVLNDVNLTTSGTISAFEGRIQNINTLDTKLSLKFGIYGLPDFKSTRFTFKLPSLQTKAQDVVSIVKNISKLTMSEYIVKTLSSMKTIGFSGEFDGSFSRFIAEGRLTTAQGTVGMNLNIKPKNARQTAFEGRVGTTDFDLGNLLSVSKLAGVSIKANLNGTIGTDSLSVLTDGKIDKIDFNGYNYSGIELRGKFVGKEFTGNIASSDPNLNFDFDGLLNYNDSIPRYNFNLALHNADLAKLNFNKRDSISIIKCDIKANGSGNALDNINGEVIIDSLQYVNQVDSVHTNRIRLVGTNSSANKLLAMYSSFADVEFRGKHSYKDIWSYFENTLLSYLPSLTKSDKKKTGEIQQNADNTDGYYLLKVDVKQANNVAGIFLPGLQLSQGSKLSFLFNPGSDMFSLTASSDYIERGDFFVSKLNLNTRNVGDSISMFVRADDIYVGGLYMPNFSVLGGVKNNQINMATRFNNKENGTYVMLSTVSTLQRDSVSGLAQIKARFFPSTITVGNQTWRVSSRNIIYDSTQIAINNFRISSAGQELLVNGVASKRSTDTLHVRLSNFDLLPFSRLTAGQGYDIKGKINGYADMASALKDGVITSLINFDSLQLNNVKFRGAQFESHWDIQAERARFILSDKITKDSMIVGYYSPKTNRYRAQVKFNNIDLSLTEPLLKGVLKNSKGTANLDILVSGSGKKPLLNGKITIPQLTTTVDYTNVPYVMQNAKVVVENNKFTLGRTKLTDPLGNKGDVDMTFNSDYFYNLTYNINVRPNKLLALNTTAKENELFYGKIFATGLMSIKGSKRGIQMNVTAETNDNSEFFMPLSNKSSISEADFIVFESAENRAKRVANQKETLTRRQMVLANSNKLRRAQGSGANMDIRLNITVTPGVEAQLVIDPTVGDIIKGRGNGLMNINVNPRNNVFTIYGDYEITEGSYLFTLQNIINKKFIIEQGSSIKWTGDPIDAMLNIKAVYKLKASLAPLLSTNADNYSRRIPVDCIINLTDKLSQPNITFDVVVPNADPETQSLVMSSINSQEMMATQFLYLLALNTFYSDNSSNMNIGTTGGAVIGLEFLSNQLSNWLSTDRFTFSPRLSSDEIGGAISAELIKDKLIFEADGGYDTGNNVMSQSPNKFMGDFTAWWLFNRSGSFKAKVFSRTIDRFDENQGLQENGIGIFYREGFNTFDELFKRFKSRFKRSPKPVADTTQMQDSVKN